MEVPERSGRTVECPQLARFAVGPVAGVAGCVAALLAGLSGRYGYHRDELYYLAAGRLSRRPVAVEVTQA